MCGVVGAIMYETEIGVPLLMEIFNQSQIRGKHATGVSFFNGEIQTIKKGVPSSEFTKLVDFKQFIHNGEIRLIGHIRYSTSDINWHQPIHYGDSIAHNGVISQEPPEKWYELYGLETETQNDSELLLRAMRHSHPELYFEKFNITPSMAYVHMNTDGDITAFRNEFRPLYKSVFEELNGSVIYASTQDIIKRAAKKFNLNPNIEMVTPGVEYRLSGETFIKNVNDLQDFHEQN